MHTPRRAKTQARLDRRYGQAAACCLPWAHVPRHSRRQAAAGRLTGQRPVHFTAGVSQGAAWGQVRSRLCSQARLALHRPCPLPAWRPASPHLNLAYPRPAPMFCVWFSTWLASCAATRCALPKPMPTVKGRNVRMLEAGNRQRDIVVRRRPLVSATGSAPFHADRNRRLIARHGPCPAGTGCHEVRQTVHQTGHPVRAKARPSAHCPCSGCTCCTWTTWPPCLR